MSFGVGGGMGGGWGVGRASPAGLPFGGIPSELQAGVDEILATEPPHSPANLTFHQRPSELEREPLRLTRLVLHYRGWLVSASFLVLVSSLVLQAGPLITELAINHGMIPHHHSTSVVLGAGGLYLVLALVGVLSQRGQAVVTGRLAARVMHDLRLRVFTHLQRLSLDFFTEEKVGVLISRMTSDIENLQQLVQDGVASFALQGLTMVVITLVLFVTNVELALWTLLLVVPPLLALSIWFHRASERGYLLSRDRIALVLADLSESLYGMRVIAATNRQRRNILNHRHVVGAYRDANLLTGRINALYGPATVALAIIVQGVLLGVGGDLVLHHQLSVGALVAFTLYVGRFFQPIQLLVQQYSSLQQSRSSITRLRELLETAPSVDDDRGAVPFVIREGAITFEHVDFGYDPSRLVLHDVSLTVEPGETVAFVGPTGAGKSTLAKLVTRFYDPVAGRVLIDGVDLRSVTQHSLRRQVGVVPQEPFLFSGSIRSNITFARPEASNEEVQDAIDQVGLRDLVDRLPEGVDTPVHERGQTLSTGERQLLALARAFLARPRVLVLDEATSSLDLRSEVVVERALDRVLEGRTAILIAHRLTTAQRADRIVVVDRGGVVEMGRPGELLAREGAYAAMYAAWLAAGGRDVPR